MNKDIKDLSGKIESIENKLDYLPSVFEGPAYYSRLKLEILEGDALELYLDKIYGRDKTQKSIFILACHDYGNVGDLAINFCEKAFVMKNFPGFPVFQLSRLAMLINWQNIVGTITKGDLIIIHGGGSLGDIWPEEEKARQKILESFPRNTIISFPQSVKFFDKTAMEQAKDVYEGHEKLLLTVRDDESLEIVQKNFSKCSVARTEDIVFTYEYAAKSEAVEHDILFVLRKDREKKSPFSIVEKIKALEGFEMDYRETDTVISDFRGLVRGGDAPIVFDKVREMAACRLIITDRLHGAIFALAARRPVVIFDNSYGKIKAALKNILPVLGERILLAEDDGRNVTLDKIKDLCAMEDALVTPSDTLSSVFDKYAEEIKGFINQ